MRLYSISAVILVLANASRSSCPPFAYPCLNTARALLLFGGKLSCDIDKALALFIKKFTNVDGLVSVGAVHLEKPDILKKVDHGNVAPLFKKSPSEGFFPYGVIYAVKTSAFKKHPTFYQKKTLAYPIERWQNYEIDDLYDFLCVEAVLKNRLAKVTV